MGGGGLKESCHHARYLTNYPPGGVAAATSAGCIPPVGVRAWTKAVQVHAGLNLRALLPRGDSTRYLN